MTAQQRVAKALREYTHALRQMELAQAAIDHLEHMTTSESSTAIRILMRGQQRQLKLFDKYAAQLTGTKS